MSPQPLLSICVPTYNGQRFIEEFLAALLPQTAAEPKVEVCVCDDASRDDTPRLIEAARARWPFRYERNEKNLGAIRNFHRLTAEIARGKYVWVLGQDDIPNPGAVRALVAALEAHPDIEIFYVNYRARKVSGPGYDLHLGNRESRRLERWQDVIRSEGSLGTGLFVHVIAREAWIAYWGQHPPGEHFSSGHATYPHCYLIADAFLNRPAWCVGEPLLTLTPGSAGWHASRFVVYSRLTPDLLYYFRAKGLSPEAYRFNARWVFAWAAWVLREELNRSEASTVSLVAPFLKRYPRSPQAWRAALHAWIHCERLPLLRAAGRIRRKLLGRRGSTPV